MALTIALLDGDGIGPEISAATRGVLEVANETHACGLEFCPFDIGLRALQNEGSTLPDSTFEKISACDGIVLGPVSHLDYPPRQQGGLNPSGELRKRLELFANLRPARSRDGIESACGKAFDLLIVRENTEGFYADRNMFHGSGEIMPTPDLALSMRKISRHACLDIARCAFDEARARRNKVTAVHKANVLRLSDGLFLECTRALADENPDIEYEEIIVDAMAAHLVRNPASYDVIVTTNMYGDILSDLASELSGGLGLAASLNAGENHAMAQAQHGSAPDIAGRGIANPTSLIGSAAMLLEWLSQRHRNEALLRASRAIMRALDDVLADPDTRTPDLGGTCQSHEFAAAVAAGLAPRG